MPVFSRRGGYTLSDDKTRPGFALLAAPEIFMEISPPGVYERNGEGR